jgi:hypothetical protein
MATNEVIVSALSGAPLADSTNFTARAGKSGEQLSADLHGKFYSRAVRGQVFIGSTPAAGCVLQKYDGTAPTFIVWNPANSGVNLELLRLNMGIHTLGTRVLNTFILQTVTGCGSAIATGAPISAFAKTPTSVMPATVTGYSSKAFFCSAGTVTLTAAGSHFCVLPFQHDHATTGSHEGTYDFDGSVIVPPGVAIYPSASTTTPGSTRVISLMWAEIPV